jgi:hypothetical protein
VTTRLYIPEDPKLHTRRRENLKSHKQWWRFLASYLERYSDNSFVSVASKHTSLKLCLAVS